MEHFGKEMKERTSEIETKGEKVSVKLKSMI